MLVSYACVWCALKGSTDIQGITGDPLPPAVWRDGDRVVVGFPEGYTTDGLRKARQVRQHARVLFE